MLFFHALSLFISFFFICIMHSAFDLFVFPDYMFTSLLLLFFSLNIFCEGAMSSPERLHLEMTIIVIVIIMITQSIKFSLRKIKDCLKTYATIK